MLAVNPNLTTAQVKQLIVASATATGGTDPSGGPINVLNEYAAVSAAIAPPSLSTGAVKVQTTMNGVAWPTSGAAGPVQYTITGPNGKLANTVETPLVVSSLPPGNYTVTFTVGGPPNATFVGIGPFGTQTLSAGSTLTFTLEFSSTLANIIDTRPTGSSVSIISGGSFSHYTTVVVSPHQTTRYDIPKGVRVAYSLSGLATNGCSPGSASILFSTSPDPAVSAFDSYSIVATTGSFTTDADIPAGAYVFGVGSSCDASRPVGFVGGGDLSSAVYLGGNWPNGAPMEVYVPSLAWNLLLTTGAAPLPTCPSPPPPVTGDGALPYRLAFSKDLTIDSLGLWTTPVGPHVYCCSFSVVSLSTDLGQVFATSANQFAGGSEAVYSFSPSVQIPAGSGFWVWIYATGNGTAVSGTNSVPFLDFKGSCGGTPLM
jgi:hypothetical protein